MKHSVALVLLRFSVGGGLLAALLMKIDWLKGFELVFQISPWLLFAAICLFPLGIILSAYKWQILLAAQNIQISLYFLSRNYWIGFFANNFLVSSVGGDVARIALLRYHGSIDRVAASVLMERLTGLIVLLVWSCGGLLLLFGRLSSPIVGVLLSTVCTGSALVMLLYFYAGGWSVWLGTLHSREQRGWVGRGTGFLLEVVRAMVAYRRQQGVVLRALWLSLIFYLTPLLLQCFLVWGSGLQVPLQDIFSFVPLIMLLGILPLTPNAIGITEGAYVFFYGLAGVPTGEALALALCARLLGMLASVVGGVLWLTKKGEGLV